MTSRSEKFHKVGVLRMEWDVPEYYDNLSLSRRSAFGIYWWVKAAGEKKVHSFHAEKSHRLSCLWCMNAQHITHRQHRASSSSSRAHGVDKKYFLIVRKIHASIVNWILNFMNSFSHFPLSSPSASRYFSSLWGNLKIFSVLFFTSTFNLLSFWLLLWLCDLIIFSPLSIAQDRRSKTSVEIKRWNITGNRELARKAYTELKMLKVREKLLAYP